MSDIKNNSPTHLFFKFNFLQKNQYILLFHILLYVSNFYIIFILLFWGDFRTWGENRPDSL